MSTKTQRLLLCFAQSCRAVADAGERDSALEARVHESFDEVKYCRDISEVAHRVVNSLACAFLELYDIGE